MNKSQLNFWKKKALLHVLSALAENNEIREILIFKGALILNRHLDTERMSLDIDSNLDIDFSLQLPERESQKQFLEEHIPVAIERYFEKQDPVRYQLKNLRIDLSPPSDHPRGWDAFCVKVTLDDYENEGIRGLPALTIDVAAPEVLSDASVQKMDWNSSSIRAYTLERIAGEKSRAFLSTLPTYRSKMKKPGEAIRTKDLYDLARILKAVPIHDKGFWQIAGKEFRLACKSRFIDCHGIDSFKESWGSTKEAFESDKIIPPDIRFEIIENTLDEIISFWIEEGIIPFEFPLQDEK